MQKIAIALSDAFLLASAKLEQAIPLFRKIEKEMKSCVNTLKRDFNIIFLSDLKLENMK